MNKFIDRGKQRETKDINNGILIVFISTIHIEMSISSNQVSNELLHRSEWHLWGE
jgi:hypothetical protein